MQDAVLNLVRVKMRDQQRLAHGPLNEYPNKEFSDFVPRSGNASGGGQPGSALKTKPGGPNDYVYVIIQPPVWAPLAKLIGRGDLAEHPEYATPEARLTAAFQAATARRPRPEEVAILGVNNDPIRCELADPALSSVAPNAFQSGYRAAAMLRDLLGGEKPKALDQRVEPLGVVTRHSTDVLAVDDRNVAAALSLSLIHI